MEKKLVVAVPDTLQALFQLAAAWRAQFTCPIVAITGSAGKTSTKEMLANILALNEDAFLASYGNQNTKIGVSLNILKMRSGHKAAIFEVGINKRGEMAELAKLIKPTTALITNVGHCHMEGLGSINDIALEKRDLFKYFTEESIGIINGDQPILSQVSYTHPVVRFGSKTTNQVQARKIKLSSTHAHFVLKIYRKKYLVSIPKPHMGAVFNALAASAAAHLLGVSDEVIVQGIQKPLAVDGRFEQCQLKTSRGIIIDDCYNANPESMKAALLAFENIKSKAKKIVVLGDMLELGVNSPFWHRQLGRFLRKVPSLKHVILVGDMIKWTQKTVPLHLTIDIVPDWQGAVTKLKEQLDDESLVLIKGSQGVGLRNLVDTFMPK